MCVCVNIHPQVFLDCSDFHTHCEIIPKKKVAKIPPLVCLFGLNVAPSGCAMVRYAGNRPADDENTAATGHNGEIHLHKLAC